MKKVVIPVIILVLAAALVWKFARPTSTIVVVAGSTPTATETPSALLAAIETDYSTPEAVTTNANQGTSILFFYLATDAQSQASQQDIATNAAMVPAGAKYFKINYATENILKDKYNVKAPDTFVVVDRQGSVTHQWTGGGVDKLNSVLMGN